MPPTTSLLIEPDEPVEPVEVVDVVGLGILCIQSLCCVLGICRSLVSEYNETDLALFIFFKVAQR